GDETQHLYQEILRRRPSSARPPSRRLHESRDPSRASDGRPSSWPGTHLSSGATQRPVAGGARGRRQAGRVVCWPSSAPPVSARPDLSPNWLPRFPETVAECWIRRCHESRQILPFGPWVGALRGGHVQED